MIDKQEAKKRMKTDWKKFVSTEEALDALLSQDQERIDEINACRARCEAYNAKMDGDVDAANEQELEAMVKAFTPYKDRG